MFATPLGKPSMFSCQIIWCKTKQSFYCNSFPFSKQMYSLLIWLGATARKRQRHHSYHCREKWQYYTAFTDKEFKLAFKYQVCLYQRGNASKATRCWFYIRRCCKNTNQIPRVFVVVFYLSNWLNLTCSLLCHLYCSISTARIELCHEEQFVWF